MEFVSHRLSYDRYFYLKVTTQPNKKGHFQK
jgi:hypothetical protein